MKLMLIVALMLGMAACGGCAVGRTETGGVVAGVEIGQMAEGANQTIGHALNGLAPGLGLGDVFLGLGGTAAVGAAARYAGKRKRSDIKREEAMREAAVLKERTDWLESLLEDGPAQPEEPSDG